MSIIKKILLILGLFKPKDINNHKDNIEICSEIKNDIINYKSYPILISSDNKILEFEKIDYRDNPKGVLEDYFFDFLTEYLENTIVSEISNSTSIKIENKEYSPDFFIRRISKNYCIEIDEPYTLNSEGRLIPTHYWGHDNERNKRMEDAGISIIRFSEEQIMKNPLECVKFIKSCISNEITEMKYKVDTWSKEKCFQLIEMKYRDSYLPKAFQNQLYKSEYSFRSLKIKSINQSKDLSKITIGVKNFNIIVPYTEFEKCFLENEIVIEYDKFKILNNYMFIQYHLLQSFRIEGFFKQNLQYLNPQNNKFNYVLDNKDNKFKDFFKKLNYNINNFN